MPTVDVLGTYTRRHAEADSVSIKSLKWNTIRYALKDLVFTAITVGLTLTVLYLASLVVMFAMGS